MSIAPAAEHLLKRLIATSGLAARQSPNDDAFWYTSGMPGPFYINTENIAGRQNANETLHRLNQTLQAKMTLEQCAKAIYDIMIQAVRSDEQYGASIDALSAYYLERHPKPTLISGGERRDWFFSIPLAAKLGVPHILLFKNGEHHVIDHEGSSMPLELRGQNVLHVADIINQASSYSKRWIPILSGSGALFTETLSVAVRSSEGLEALGSSGITVVSPLVVDRPLFRDAYDLGLIPLFAYQQIMQFYESPLEWTRSYIGESASNRTGINEQAKADLVKTERVKWFKAHDPFGLKAEFPGYFAD